MAQKVMETFKSQHFFSRQESQNSGNVHALRFVVFRLRSVEFQKISPPAALYSARSMHILSVSFICRIKGRGRSYFASSEIVL